MVPIDLIYTALQRVIQRILRRTVAWLVVAIALLAALYQATVAVTVELELQFGSVYGHLAIAAFYVAVAVVGMTILWLTARRTAISRAYRVSVAQLPPELQVATIVEALLLGYTMARRK